jgi:hypothetical protein
MANALPPGITLNPTTGQLTGTLTELDSFYVDILVRDSVGNVSIRPFSLVATTPLTIVTSSIPYGVVANAYTDFTIEVSGGAPAYAFQFDTLVGDTLPDGLSIDGMTGVISGTPTTPGTYNLILVISDNYGVIVEKPLTFIITTPLVLSTTSLPSGLAYTAYNTTLTGSGGQTPYTWSITSGLLPDGLTFNTSTGILSGTPTNVSDVLVNLTFKLVDALGQEQTKSLALAITGVSPVLISTTSLPNGSAQVAYSATLQATGGRTPYSWSIISGTLPAGLSLAAATGVISGTPTITESVLVTLTVQVTDSVSQTASTSLSFGIEALTTLVISSSILPSGTSGIAYNGVLSGSGGKTPYSWSITSGTLPTGLSLNTSTGVISGTPTVTTDTVITITVKLTDSVSNTVSKSISFSILAVSTDPSSLNILTTELLPANTQEPYDTTLQATGGTPPYRWSFEPVTDLEITTSSVDSGVTLIEYMSDVQANGGTPPYTYETIEPIDVIPHNLASMQALWCAFKDVPTCISLEIVGGEPPFTWVWSKGTSNNIGGIADLRFEVMDQSSDGRYARLIGTLTEAGHYSNIKLVVTDNIGQTFTTPTFSFNVYSSTAAAPQQIYNYNNTTDLIDVSSHELSYGPTVQVINVNINTDESTVDITQLDGVLTSGILEVSYYAPSPNSSFRKLFYLTGYNVFQITKDASTNRFQISVITYSDANLTNQIQSTVLVQQPPILGNGLGNFYLKHFTYDYTSDITKPEFLYTPNYKDLNDASIIGPTYGLIGSMFTSLDAFANHDFAYQEVFLPKPTAIMNVSKGIIRVQINSASISNEYQYIYFPNNGSMGISIVDWRADDTFGGFRIYVKSNTSNKYYVSKFFKTETSGQRDLFSDFSIIIGKVAEVIDDNVTPKEIIYDPNENTTTYPDPSGTEVSTISIGYPLTNPNNEFNYSATGQDVNTLRGLYAFKINYRNMDMDYYYQMYYVRRVCSTDRVNVVYTTSSGSNYLIRAGIAINNEYLHYHEFTRSTQQGIGRDFTYSITISFIKA